MPAPQPIDVRYGNVTDLLTLAGQAGAAQHANRQTELGQQYGMDVYRMRYNDYLRRLARDETLTQFQLGQTQQANLAGYEGFTQARALERQMGAQTYENELHAAATWNQGIREDARHTDRMALDQRRLGVQTTGSFRSGQGQSNQPVRLVPWEGDIDASDAGPTITAGLNGRPTIQSRPGPRLPMVTEQQRKIADQIRNDPTIDGSTKERLLGDVLADDTITMRGMRDNIQQERNFLQPKGNDTALRTYTRRLSEIEAGERTGTLEAVLADHKFVDPYGELTQPSKDPRREAARQGEVRRIAAQAKAYYSDLIAQEKARQPVVNSSGQSPLGGNDPALQARTAAPPFPRPTAQAPVGIVKVNTPTEAANLPSGTMFVDPSGVVRRVP